MVNNDDGTIPDASKWSFNEVYEYFHMKFPRHAYVFDKEEIDGEAILLITRDDVLERFDIPLGRALKIYDHIRMMQLKMKNLS